MAHAHVIQVKYRTDITVGGGGGGVATTLYVHMYYVYTHVHLYGVACVTVPGLLYALLFDSRKCSYDRASDIRCTTSRCTCW